MLSSYRYLALIAGIIIILDQISKAYIRANFAIGEMWVPWEWLAPYARIVRVTNTGVAFGMFQGNRPVLIALAILVSAAIIYYYPRVPLHDWTLRLALSMQLGGAVGNLIDRIFIGQVTDFISVGTFPVFNIADSSITVGVGVLILGVWIQERQEKKARAGGDPSKADEQSPDGEPLHCE